MVVGVNAVTPSRARRRRARPRRALGRLCRRPAEPVTVVAEGIAFTPTTIALPAGQGFHLTFENRDSGVPHGLSLQTRTSGVPPKDLWTSEIQAGPSVTEYDIPALAAGPYLLMCPVHPNMQVEIDVT
jgi:plastocyanin